jgi:hypothetical protein
VEVVGVEEVEEMEEPKGRRSFGLALGEVPGLTGVTVMVVEGDEEVLPREG